MQPRQPSPKPPTDRAGERDMCGFGSSPPQGPILGLAPFVGYLTAGLWGAVAATVGVFIMPWGLAMGAARGPTGPPEESAGSGFRQGGGARNRESLRLGGADDRPRASRCSLDRETSASFAPSAAIKRAVSAPSPLLPPVMTATLSVSFKSIGIRHPRRQSVGVWNCAVGGPAGRTRAPLANSTCTRAKPWSIAR